MSIQSLIDGLAQPGLTLDVIGQKRQEIIQSGSAAIDPLLVALEKRQLSMDTVTTLLRDILLQLTPEQADRVSYLIERRLEDGVAEHVKRVVLRLVNEGFCLSVHTASALFRLAEDRSQSPALRGQAFTTLAKAPMQPGWDERLLGLLADPDDDVTLAALAALEGHAAQVDRAHAQQALWQMAVRRSALVRRRSIVLLGTFGEVDVIERVCLLPGKDTEDIQAVQQMVERILQRPRRLQRLRPDNFEHLIQQLLIKMGFDDVRVTGRPWDGGVDLTRYATRWVSPAAHTVLGRMFSSCATLISSGSVAVRNAP